ncbi:MAG: hypothetical protein U0V75_07380 [Ferruginibacter sp.]
MKLAGPAFLALLLTFISCKKSSSDSAPAPVEPFMSLTAGNSRTYETVNNLTTVITTNTQLSTNRDSSINGKSYHVFTNSNGSPNEYFNVSGSDYYTFRNLTPLGTSSTVEHIYLKDNMSVGQSWSQTITIAPFSGVPTTVPLTITNTITEKGISRTVNGKTYNNVIHITTLLSSSSLPAGSLTTDIHTYYAPKYGMIESRNKITITLVTGNNVDQNTTLKTANF